MQRIPKYLSQNEVRRLFYVITDKRDRALFGLIYYYGLRVSEVPLLILDSVDMKNRRIRLQRLRGGVTAEKVLWSSPARLLRVYLRVRIPKGLALFTGRQGPLKRRTIQYLFSKYAQEANLPFRNVHALRHSIAIHTLDRGDNRKGVLKLLGQRHITSTAIYEEISASRRETLTKNSAVVMI